MDIDRCSECRDHFLASVTKQAAVRFELAKFGEPAAKVKMEELMESVHDDHFAHFQE